MSKSPLSSAGAPGNWLCVQEVDGVDGVGQAGEGSREGGWSVRVSGGGLGGGLTGGWRVDMGQTGAQPTGWSCVDRVPLCPDAHPATGQAFWLE